MVPEDVPPPGQNVSDKPHYADFAPRIVGRGKPAVLFFHKPSDPFSVRNDTLLKKLYSTGGIVVSTYKIDFSSSTGARLTYGVVVEDTFVLLDTKGERVGSFLHPTPEEIHIILRGKVPVPPKL